MQLDIPLIRQDKNSSDCGLACVAMLLQHYGLDANIAQLQQKIEVYKNIGTFAPQLGKYLIDSGFEVDLITQNPHLFTINDRDKTQDDLKVYFKELILKNTKESRINSLKHFDDYLTLNGKSTVQVPSVDDIKNEIKQGRPLISLLTTNFLQHDKAGFNFHFNLITGIDDIFIYVHDPLSDKRGGKKKYKINDYMYALYASAFGDIDNASLLKVRLINN